MSFQTPLSPVDHVFTGNGAYPINFIFFFDQQIDSYNLKESLNKTLDIFLPFKSTLQQTNAHILAFVESTESYGWKEQSLKSWPNKDDFEELDTLIEQAHSVPGKALLQITLSHFSDKSILGVSASHCVVDGYSYFMFLTAWSKIFRDQPIVTPDLDRRKLVPENVQAKSFSEDEVFQHTGFAYVNIDRPTDSSKVKWQVFDYSKTKLNELYEKVSAHSDIRLSLNDVLGAQVWKEFVANKYSSDAKLSLSCAYDYRRIFPKIGPSYFGNAIRAAFVQLSALDVEQKSIAEIAIQLNRAVKSISEQSVLDSLQCLEDMRANDGLPAMQRFHVAHPQTGFLVTNLSRLPLFDIDFGCGAPIDFRILTPAKKTAVLLPLQDGIRIQIAT